MKIRKHLIIISITLFFFIGIKSVQAVETYFFSEVEQHNTSNNCWVVFEEGVYDITDYLQEHDVYLDIRSWCGQDMTEDFVTKADMGEDHKPQGYSLLSVYKIGELKMQENVDSNTPVDENEVFPVSSDTNKRKTPYNVAVPFVSSLVLYIASWVGVNKKKLSKSLFNSFWNTILIICLIPSGVFGLYMILSYSFPDLRRVDFDFTYWHVEGSIVFLTILVLHIIARWKQYTVQLKTSVKK